MNVPLPANEPERLRALRAYGLLDTEPEPAFDRITALASYLFETPIALMTLIDDTRQWFKSRLGVPFLEIPREYAFCSYTILDSQGLVVPNALEDERFAKNPFVVNAPWVRFYAGMPLITQEGCALGTLCVIDTRPRSTFGPEQRRTLAALTFEVMAHASVRHSSVVLAKTFLDHRQVNQRQMLKCRNAAAIAAAPDVAQALQVTLEQICEVTGWNAGISWTLDERTKSPECGKAWHSMLSGIESLRNGDSEQRFQSSDSLPGRAWREARPALLRDVNNKQLDHGFEAAAALGFKAAAAFPVIVDGAVIAVLEFLMLEWREENEKFIELVAEVLSQLGTLLQRKGLDERLREHEAELSRDNQIKDHFFATLAHELRNPLAPILNAVELLRTPHPGDAVEVIERQVHHMTRLVDDLLDVSRIARGKITLHKRPIDLVEAVRAAVRTARALFIGRDHALSTSLPREKLWMEADPVRIEQIAGNLLNNALKYTGPEKPIALSLRRDGNQALLVVRDGGIGIAPEMQERIFQPFVQVQESLPLTRGGLGLGLALVRQLVELHGGTVSVKSEGPGMGAEFSVRFPLAATPSETNPQKKESAKAEAVSAAVRRVLVVEDNPDLAETLSRLLTHWGHAVAVASTGTAALAKASEFNPDIALVDIGLPGIDGYAVAGQLASSPKFSGIQLIAISGYGQDTDRARAVEAGFEDYLLKPVDPASLRERLGRS